MPHITYQNEKLIEVEPATTILQASLQNGIPHTHVCGGNARCSTCRVLVLSGLEHCCPRNEKEQKMAERRHFSPAVRLACQTTLGGDVTLRRLVIDNEDEELVDQEVAGGTAPRSVGEEKQIAILFSDIRGFTAFSEAHLPYDVIHVLNRYFNRVGSIINRHGGQIDNFMGDGIMALFGLDDAPDATLRAVRAGVEMLAAVEAMQPYFEAQFKTNFRIGIGLHFGEVVLGVVGVGERRRLTAIGDAVNLASRIESANKEARTEFLISEDAYEQVKSHVQIGRHIELPIKGKTGEYSLHEVLTVN
ncbi:MAG: adenylate/guanylate cyclase domain-containing protein [Chloroflexi bacterium]|nr:adenylate/guanylate cyclase domain-containing protein [Chloroflexota bacterium]